MDVARQGSKAREEDNYGAAEPATVEQSALVRETEERAADQRWELLC